MPKENPLWLDDNIQFPRLIAELWGVGITSSQYKLLAENMDLSEDEIDELFERADARWQTIKANLLGRRLP